MTVWSVITVLLFSLNYSLILSLQCMEKKAVISNAHECSRTCEYPAQPKVCEYVFEAKWFYSMSAFCFDCPINIDDCSLDQCITVDGSSRPVVVTNSTIPGPSIQVCEGDIVQVKLINNLQDHGSLTIHWYGMHQLSTNWMDGASMITQCPVVSSSSFVYEFKAEPAGTHWWHAHSGYQRDDGMYGSLIVKQAEEVEHNSNVYDFDLPEHVMLVADWKSRPALSTFLMTESPTSYVVEGDQTFSILVNGKSKKISFFDDDGTVRWTPITSFVVEKGNTYRFRTISAAFGLCNLQVSIESHPLTIIAVDGAEVTPKEVDTFVIAPGERYDFLLKATEESAAYCVYFIGTESTDCVDDGFAILQYSGGSFRDSDDICYPHIRSPTVLTDTPIFSVIESNSLGDFDQDLYTVDAKYYLALDYYATLVRTSDGTSNTNSEALSYFQIDNIRFVYPESPLVSYKKTSLELCEPNEDQALYYKCADELCSCTSIMKLPLGKVVEFIVFNRNEADYSVHVHGNSFRVLAQDTIGEQYKEDLTKEYVKDLDNKGILTRRSPAHALTKDTVSVPAFGYVILRWKTDNPGYWLFHAQTNSHLETGQATILQIGDVDEIPLPPDDMPTCGPWAPTKH